MKIDIKIHEKGDSNQRAVDYNGLHSHNIDEDVIQELLKTTHLKPWQSNRDAGILLGKSLYEELNGSGGRLDQKLKKGYDQSQSITLYLDIPKDLTALPFELLHNAQFIVQHPRFPTHIIRKVCDEGGRRQKPPEQRPLKVLFMTCSPQDFGPHNALRLEEEEGCILSATQKYNVDMEVEDSGSLTGLSNEIVEGGGGYDIVHITGHSSHDPFLGPVFYMEDDVGQTDKVTPDRLWESLKKFPPRVLFLSGCMTVKDDKASDNSSFAYAMIEKGIPVVLGWNFPVIDSEVTLMTTSLYESLGVGHCIIDAVHTAQSEMKESYSSWPLLRVMCNAAPFESLIAPGQTLRYLKQRDVLYQYLENRQVKVLVKGFVGRRRQIQKGVRTMKGIPDQNGTVHSSILIHGPSGVGKSCLAGKLMERFKERERLVIHGKIEGEGDIVQRLRKLLMRKGDKEALKILLSDMPYKKRIQNLFREAFAKLPIVIYLDDFEQNLFQKGERFQIEKKVIPILTPILDAIDLNPESKSRVIITSRYPFTLEHFGNDLALKLTPIPLMAFKDADLNKKMAELPFISQSKHKAMYLRFGKGNCRLLEWLERIAEDEKKYDLKALENTLKDKNEDYISDYLVQFLINEEDMEFSTFLNRASVYQSPVPPNAYEPFGPLKYLEKGVNLTLMEKESTPEYPEVYWVNPVIREKRWLKLSLEAQKEGHQYALSWYEAQQKDKKKLKYKDLQTCLHHAISGDRIFAACPYAIVLSAYLEDMNLYQDAINVLHSVAIRLNEDKITDVINEKNENMPRLLNNLGGLYDITGDYDSAKSYYESALKIRKEVLGESHPDTASSLNNLGGLYDIIGDYDSAKPYYESALKIVKEVLGESHPYTASSLNNLGGLYQAIGNYDLAKPYCESALKIVRDILGESHPTTVSMAENLEFILQKMKKG